MKHKRGKWFSPSISTPVWLINATFALLAVVSPLFVLVPKGYAANGWINNTTWSANFVNAGQIKLTASGTVQWPISTGGYDKVDVSQLSGTYTDASDHFGAYSGKPTRGGAQGAEDSAPFSGAEYWYNDNTSACSSGGGSTDIKILTYKSGGSTQVSVYPYLTPQSGSVDVNKCQSVQFGSNIGSININVSDPSTGAGGNASKVVFNTSGGGIQTLDGANKYDLNQGSTTVYTLGGSNSDGCTGDTITAPAKTTGSYFSATLNEHTGPGCSPSKETVVIQGSVDATSSSGGGGGGTCNTDANGNCTASNPDAISCTSGGGFFTAVLNWILCGAINLAWGAANLLDNWIMNTLDIDASGIFDNTTSASSPPHGYYIAWNSFRVLSTALLVIAGLIMVIAQAAGFEALDAYTIRKVLPRLLIAIIGISLSWPLMRLVVDFFDTAGLDIREIMYAPFQHMGGKVSAGVGILSYLGVGATLFVMGPASLTFLLTAMLAAFVGFLVLVIRQIAIVMLVILAPLAIACYILPNTQKIWKLWYDNFLGLMLMFPIISALIAAGHIFAAVTDQGGPGGGVVAQAIGLMAYFAPYFMIPFAARMATGVIGNVAGFVNDRHRGAFDRLKGARQQGAASRHKERMEGKTRFGSGKTGELYRRAALAGREGSWNPGAGGRRKFAQHERKVNDAVVAEALKNDNGRAAGDDIANEVAQAGDTNARNFVGRYAKLAVQKGQAKTLLEGEQQARDAAGLLEVGYGARMGSDAMRIASFKARQMSVTGYGDSDQALADRFNDAHTMVADGLMNASDAMATIKQNKARVEASGISFGKGLEMINKGNISTLANAPTAGNPTGKSDTQLMMDTALEGLTPQSLIGARKEAGTVITRHLQRHLEQTVDAAGGRLDDTSVKRVMGQISGIQDTINSQAPQMQTIFADNLLAQHIGDTDIRVRDYADNLRAAQDSDFNDVRKEWLGSGVTPGALGGGGGGTPPPATP